MSCTKIRDRAHAGFEFKGQYVDGLHIKTDREGKLSKNGIDIAFQVGGTSESHHDGQTFYNVDLASQRLKMTFALNESLKGGITDAKSVFEAVDTWTHESFYHGNYVESSYLKIKNSSSFPNWNGGTRGGLHRIDGFNSGPHRANKNLSNADVQRLILNSDYANEQFGGYSLLKRTSKRLGLPYTREQIWNEMMQGF